MIEIGFAIGACSPIARPVITGVDSDLPEIDSTTTDFALECAKEDADDALYGEKFVRSRTYDTKAGGLVGVGLLTPGLGGKPGA